MDWKNGESEIIVIKLARLPLSAFMSVGMSRGETRATAAAATLFRTVPIVIG